MKILMVLESEFPPDVRVENEIAALSGEGHEVHLACSTRKNKPCKETIGKAFVHRKRISKFIYKSSVGSLKFPFYFNFWRRFIFPLVAAEKFDVIHIHDLPLAIIGAEIKTKYRIPMVLDLHENWPALLRNATHTATPIGKLLYSDRQWTEYEKKFTLKADLIITIIEEAGERIINLGVDPARICIVSNSVNPEGLSIMEKKRNDDSFVLFYGGGINRHRGLQVVLEAISLLKARNIKIILEIVGSGSYLADLRIITEKLAVGEQVRFHGHKPFDAMLDMLSEADAAIIPHLRTDNNDASSPNKLYQYMYLGKPVISSDCLSLKRILNETNAGFIYRNDSAVELADLLEKLINDRHLLEEKGLNGRKAILGGLNWNTEKEKLIKAYTRLAKDTK